MRSRAFLLLACLAAACTEGMEVRPEPVPEISKAPATAAAAPILQRVAVMGASASAGFNIKIETGIDVPLAVVLDRVLEFPHEEVLNLSSDKFFLDPDGHARSAVEQALAHRSTLVVAVDFLFWFGYGFAPGDEQRMRRFEAGLAWLERLACPVLVSELPDMSWAVETGALHRAQVPSAASIARMNARLRAWVAERPEVLIVPMADFLDRLRAGERVALGKVEWNGEESAGLLQDDRLHPTLEGLAALAYLCLESTRAWCDCYPAEAYRSDPRVVALHLGLDVEDDPSVLGKIETLRPR